MMIVVRRWMVILMPKAWNQVKWNVRQKGPEYYDKWSPSDKLIQMESSSITFMINRSCVFFIVEGAENICTLMSYQQIDFSPIFQPVSASFIIIFSGDLTNDFRWSCDKCFYVSFRFNSLILFFSCPYCCLSFNPGAPSLELLNDEVNCHANEPRK